jgi:predicted 3-demethylubiquinone-9 3-methyltransferase (glyoxalase superfamily)
MSIAPCLWFDTQGEEGPCGWLKDRYGVSWQVVPNRLPELLADPDPEITQRVTAAMLQMHRIDIAALEAAAEAARAEANGSRAER